MLETPQHIYRLRHYYRNVGMLCTPLFLVAWIAGIHEVLTNKSNPAAHPIAALVFISVILGGFTFMGLYIILAYYKEHLILNDREIRHVGAFRTKSVPWQSIQQIKWRIGPSGGSAILYGNQTKIKIEFGNFIATQRAEIIEIIHHNVDDVCYLDWSKFHKRFRPPTPEAKRKTRALARRMAYAITAIGVLIFVAGFVFSKPQFYFEASLNLLGGFVALYLTRKPPQDDDHTPDSQPTH